MNLLEQFINILQAQKPSPSRATVKNYKADIAKFIRWFETTYASTFDPKAVTAQMIQAYQSFATKTALKEDSEASNLEKLAKSTQNPQGQGLALKSFERHLSSLRKFFNFLKLAGHISTTPFEQIQTSQPQIEADPWHLKEFKDHLYVFNASDLTIKNYIIDVKQFLSWAEKVLGLDQLAEISKRTIFPYITTELINEYKTRLHTEAGLSPVSINRKLSSLRRFVAWAQAEEYIPSNKAVTISAEVPDTIVEEEVADPLADTELIHPTTMADQSASKDYASSQNSQVIGTSRYSKIPPIRLFQKFTSLFSLVLESALVAPLAALAVKLHLLKWQATGASVFSKKAVMHGTSATQTLLDAANKAVEHNPLGVIKVHNFKKEMYAPLSISTAEMPLHRKTWHHMRHTRPQWYKRYHQNPIVHYFHFAILVIIMTAIGAGMYQSFINDPAMKKASAAPTAPPRILSFQGRLTDASDNPITTAATPLRFAIYNSAAATGSALLWQEIVSVSPDADGIFSILLGQNTQIPQTLFGDNPALWLGVTVQATPELAPRQQIATVPYATNSELLQGMAPITQIGAGESNVVLALDSNGDLTIGGSATPVFQSTGGSFTIQGTTTVISTTAGSNGNVIIAPDGTGMIDLQHPVFNSTTGNNKIPTAIGSVEVDDLFAVLATSSGQSAVTINQDGSGPILSASASGVAKFTVANTGQLSSAAYTTAGGILYGTATGLIAQTAAGTSTQCLLGGLTPTFGTCGDDYWDLQNGLLYSGNTTVDFALGGLASSSAKFSVLNINNGTPTASVSSGVNGTGMYYTADGTLATTRRQSLIIGNSATYDTTGNILLNPNGIGNVGIGTSAPLSPLHISESMANAQGVIAQSTAANDANDFLNMISGRLGYAGGTDGAGNIRVGKEQNWTSTGTTRDAFMSFYTATDGLSTEKMRITSDGNVGIGTTLPGQRFSVAGSATISATLSLGPLTQAAAGTCNVSSAGKLYYDGGFNTYYFCNGTTWTAVGTGSGAGSFWGQQDGLLYPLNSTVDFAIGGQASSAAKFAVLNVLTGTPTASVSAGAAGAAYLNATGTLATTAFQTLTLGGTTTGNVLIDSGNGSITLADATTIASNLTVAGTTGVTLTGNGADFLFNGGGTNTISSTGTLEIGAHTLTGAITGNNQNVTGLNNLSAAGTITFGSFVNNGGVLFTNGTGVVSQTNVGTATQCLVGGTTPSFSACNVGTADYFWNQANGALFANNSTVDLLIGGQASESAKFAVLNVSGGTPTASVSAGAAGAFYIRADGTLATTAMQSITIGNGTTGNVIFNPAGNVGIGTATPLEKLDVAGSATISGNLTLYGGTRSIQATENQTFTLGGNTTGNIVFSPLNGSGDVRINGTTTLGGQTYTWPGAQIVDSLLTTNGSGTLSWTSALDVGPWLQRNGSLFPKNTTVDLLIGGQSTASAKFAVLNMNTGTPVASVSSGVGGNGFYFTADGVLATANQRTLTLGDGNTGHLVMAPDGTARMIVHSDGNVGIGTLTPTGNLHILGAGAQVQKIESTGGSAAQLHLRSNGIDGFIESVSGSGINIYGANGDNAAISLNASDVTNQLYLATSGRIGMGTASPLATLDLRGNLGTIPAASVSASSSFAALVADNRGVGDIFSASSSGLPRFTVRQNGNVDIQTLSAGGIIKSTTPNGTLAIATAGVDYEHPLTFTNGLTRSVNTIRLGGALTANTDIPLSGFNLVMSGTGNVGIGNTTADQRLQIGDYSGTNYLQVTSTASSGNQAGIKLQEGNSSGNRWDMYLDSTSNMLRFAYNGSAQVYFDNSGNVGIANTNPQAKLDVTGNFILTGTTTFNGDTYTWPTGGSQNAGFVLTTNGLGTLSWADPAGGASNYWLSNNGALYPKNSTLDFFIGGQATNSAKFAVLNMNNGTPTASISAGANALSLNANGVIGTYSQGPLTLGNNTTGDIIIAPDGSAAVYIKDGGNVGIGIALPRADLDIQGDASASGTLWLSGQTVAGSTIQSTAYETLTLGGSSTGNIVLSPKGGSGQIVLTPFSTDGGVLYTDTTGTIKSTPNGSFSQCLLGGANPTWGACGTGSDAFWIQNPQTGALYATNSTVDFFLGGQATNSAKFAVLNMNNGTPIASVAGNISLGSDPGTIRTIGATAMNSLQLGDATTGDLLFSPGNTLSLILRAGGNVGIGYSNPLGKLAVNGNVGIGTSNPNTYLEVGGVGGVYDTTPRDIFRISNTDVSTTNSMAAMSFWANRNGNVQTNLASISAILSNATTTGYRGELAFSTAPAGSVPVERLRINSFGSIGVGITNPLATLDVRGNIGTIPAASFSANTSLATLMLDNTQGDVLAASTSGITRFVIRQTGNVGIGTADPQNARLVLDGPQNTGLRILNSDAQRGLHLAADGTAGSGLGKIYTTSSGYHLTFGIDSVEKMRLDTTGNLGIGTTLPTQRLTVAGSATISATLSLGPMLQVDAGTCNPAAAGKIYYSASNEFYYCNASGWTPLGTGGGQTWWNMLNGMLSPINTTLDFALGGIATNTAKFSVLNMNPGSGTPIASVSSGLGGNSMYMTADGTLATQNKRSLVIGNSSTYDTTGHVLIHPSGTGNVGIGTTNPGAQLEVKKTTSAIVARLIGGNGTDNVQLRFQGNATGVDQWAIGNEIPTNGTGRNFDIFDTVSSVNRFRIDSTGNVGIGTTTPVAKFEVNSNLGTAPAASISANTNSFAAMVVNNDGLGSLLTASASGLTRFTVTNLGDVVAAGQIRMGNYTTAQASTLAPVGKGALYYNTDLNSLFISHDGATWSNLSGQDTVQFTNRSGGSVSQYSIVVLDTTADSSFTTTVSAYNQDVIGVTDSATCASLASCLITISGKTTVRIANNVTRGDYIYTSTTAGQAWGSANQSDGMLGIALTSGSAGGTVEVQLMPQLSSQATAAIDKGSKHNQYRLAVNDYDETNSGTNPNTNPVMRELFYDNFLDNSKVGTASGVGGPWQASNIKDNTSTGPNTPVAPFRVGLSGGQTYSTSTTDNNGLTYLGSNNVNDIHYYDRTRDSSPATLVNLGIDPNWYNGVTLSVGTTSADFSQNDTNPNQHINPNLSTSYNGSLVLVSGQMNTAVANPAKTVYMTVKSTTASTVTFDWTDGINWRINNTYTFGQLTQLQTNGGTNTGVYVRFMKSTKYNVGDVFKIHSWYIENTTSSTTRGGKAQFPERSYIVGTNSSVEIIDADTQKLWMRFTLTSNNMFGPSGTTPIAKSVDMLNGRLYVAEGTSAGVANGMGTATFDSDGGSLYYTSGFWRYKGSIAERNSAKNISLVNNTSLLMTDANAQDVSVAVVPNHPTKTVTVNGWGYVYTDGTATSAVETVKLPYKFNTNPTVQMSFVARQGTTPTSLSDCTNTDASEVTTLANSITTSNFRATLRQGVNMALGYYCYTWTATGEVSPKQFVAVGTGNSITINSGATTIINETDQSLVNVMIGSQVGAAVQTNKVKLLSDGTLYAAYQGAYIMPYYGIHGLTASETVWVGAMAGYYGNTQNTGSWGHLRILTSDLRYGQIQSLEATQGTSTIDGKSNTLYIGTKAGLTVLQEKQSFGSTDVTQVGADGSEENNGSVKYYSAPQPSGDVGGLVTEEMVGDIRGMWPLAANTTLSMADASIKNNPLTNNGSATATSGVRGVGVSLNGSSQYLSCTDVSCGGSLDMGSNSWSMGAWIKTTATTRGAIISKGTTADFSYELMMQADGTPRIALMQSSGALYLNAAASTLTVNDGKWHHVVMAFNASSPRVDLYVDGVLVAHSTSTSGSLDTDSLAAFEIGRRADNAFYFNGAIDEPFVTAEYLAGQKIKQMYNVGYRALQGHSSPSILGNLNADQNQQLSGATQLVTDAKPDFNNQYMYVSSSDTTTVGRISQMDLSSDTVVKQFRSSGNNPTGGTTPINGTIASLAVGYTLEAASASTAGVMSFAPDNNANGTSGTYESATFQALETFSQAYVWVSAVTDLQDPSSAITTYVSNNDGASYTQCNLSNTDTGQTPYEYEYFCQFNTPGDELKVQFSMNRGSTKSNTYITRYGVAWIDANAQALAQASSGFYTNTNSSVANGGYLEVAHNQGTYDLLTNGWIYDNGVWKQLDGSYKAAYMWEGKDSLRLDLLQEALKYRPSNETDTYTRNLIERGFLFDTFEDGSKFDATNSATAILQPFKEDTGAMKVSQVNRVQKGRAGLTGNMILNTTNTDSAGNAYLGSATVNKIFYYDRPVRDSSPEVQVNLGIDPNWANGVTLTVATGSANFSQNDTNCCLDCHYSLSS